MKMSNIASKTTKKFKTKQNKKNQKSKFLTMYTRQQGKGSSLHVGEAKNDRRPTRRFHSLFPRGHDSNTQKQLGLCKFTSLSSSHIYVNAT